jgi:hypothetical protein
MKTPLIIALSLSLTGCYTETHIKRTVQHSDGTTETYENNSHGYNYNPNYTGTWDSHINQNTRWNTQFPPPPPNVRREAEKSDFPGNFPDPYATQFNIR